MVGISTQDASGELIRLAAQAGASLTREQVAFNRLVEQIGKRRQQLQDWDEALHAFRQTYLEKLQPMRQACLAARIELLMALDAGYDGRRITRTEKKKLSWVIGNLAERILDENPQSEDVKTVFQRHTGVDFDAEQAATQAAFKARLEEDFGLDLDDEDIADPDALMARLRAQQQAEQGAFSADTESAQHGATAEAASAHRAFSAREAAAEARQAREAQQLSQSVRDVFRKVASALHPDREPDPALRERKTALMQQANQAYEQGNLLQLLELQMALEQTAPGRLDLAQLTGERLRRYLKVLKAQVARLDEELVMVEEKTRFDFSLPYGERLQPRKLQRWLKDDMASAKRERADLRAHLATVRDPVLLSLWLRTVVVR